MTLPESTLMRPPPPLKGYRTYIMVGCIFIHQIGKLMNMDMQLQPYFDVIPDPVLSVLVDMALAAAAAYYRSKAQK